MELLPEIAGILLFSSYLFVFIDKYRVTGWFEAVLSRKLTHEPISLSRLIRTFIDV